MISFLITTKNEGDYIDTLLEQISLCMTMDDEIVIIDDYSDDIATLRILDKWKFDPTLEDRVFLHKHHLNDDFASHKNFGLEHCVKDWVFQLDADELMSEALQEHLHNILESNGDNFDLYLIPRVNIVTGLTETDIDNFGWTVNENSWAMWPDFQTRLFRNTGKIHWVNKVHERLVGPTQWTMLPDKDIHTNEPDASWAILHYKNIIRQRLQNEYYKKISDGTINNV